MPEEVVSYLTTSESLESIADAIREKGGTTEPLQYPEEFVTAIMAIETATHTEIWQDELGCLHIPDLGWIRTGEIVQDEDGYIVLSEEAAVLLQDATGILFGT